MGTDAELIAVEPRLDQILSRGW